MPEQWQVIDDFGSSMRWGNPLTFHEIRRLVRRYRRPRLGHALPRRVTRWLAKQRRKVR